MSKRDRAAAWEAATAGAAAAETARVLLLLAQARQRELMQLRHHGAPFPVAEPLASSRGGGNRRVFECKTCSRQFPTFQALGGHRASHKRPRLLQREADHAELCLGRQPPPLLPPPPTPQKQHHPAKPRVHECPVCGLEFPIGQALGGHMRRHRAEADGSDAHAPTKQLPAASEKTCDVAGGICLDLNLTPSENCAKCRNVLVRGTPGGKGVHKTLAMLDCSL